MGCAGWLRTHRHPIRGSVLIRVYIPQVPRLIYEPASRLRRAESQCAVVINSHDVIGTPVQGFPVLALLVLQDFYLIPNGIGVRDTLRVLFLVVLNDDFLSSVFNELPIGFETDVVDRVSTKDQLCRRGTHGGMHSGSHRKAKGCQDSLPTANGFEVSLVLEVVRCLLYTSPSPRDGLLSRMPSSA